MLQQAEHPAPLGSAPSNADPLAGPRLDELLRIIETYNQVAVKLEQTHQTLTEEVRRLQAQLASANAELGRSKRLTALGEMAAGIAHEIRNPLASIQLYATLIEKDLADRPPQQELARKIGLAVRGLEGIVGDVLTFARELKLRRRPHEVSAMLDRAVEAVGPLVEQAKIEVRYAVEPEGLTLDCDGELLHQALVNLVRNAAEAMEQTGGTLMLGAAEGDAGWVRVAVRDTGPGISDEAIDRIFNPFFTTRATGTGLGLAIVHRIIDAHGGSIAVENALDGGAVFTLSLPSEIKPPRHQVHQE